MRPDRPAGTLEDSAQRLSASQRWASACGHPLYSRAECSTPFGITEVGMTLSAWVKRAVSKCSTPFGITEVGIVVGMCDSSAQVGAQRLSASQRWAFGVDRRTLRRHGVLNAFRHHRGGHQQLGDGRRRNLVCSTPFGITEVGIGATRPRGTRSPGRAQRLSASQRWASPPSKPLPSNTLRRRFSR